ncbi:Tetraspanin [Fasciolopsis buskii]|uniref:Tetraspanin n=1 Tax=Fasciolopsis buskii TaxID=27845 RepID=A0A8E0VQT4_9TREM|nr:Tetraspanin [Fasciolopsis buski]
MYRAKHKSAYSVCMYPPPIKSPAICTERNCVRFFGNFFCLFIVSLGAGLSATAAYVLVNYEYIGEIFGRELFFGGVYTLLASGVFAVMTGFLGFYDFTHENRFTAILTASGILILTIIVLISGIVVYSFPRSLQNVLFKAMATSLPEYGLRISVTRAWDRTQSYLRCCAVRNLGWADYKNTSWYLQVNRNLYDPDNILQTSSPYYTAVPASCCATQIDALTGYATETYRDLYRCQRWQYGPPQLQSGPHNDALYYRGCFPVLVDYMTLHTRHLLGLSLALIGIMLITFILLIMTKLMKKEREKKT